MWKYVTAFILFITVSCWVAPTVAEEESSHKNGDSNQHMLFSIPNLGELLVKNQPEVNLTDKEPLSIPLPLGRSVEHSPFRKMSTKNIGNKVQNKLLSPFSKSTNVTNSGERQFFGIANHLSNGSIVPPMGSGNGTNQFFGIANLYFGRDNSCNETCPKCPIIPVLGPATVHVTATACATIDTLSSCSVATLAPKGSAFVLFLTTTAGSAVVGIVAQAPNTKVTITCYNIPNGITVKSQSGVLTANVIQQETGYAQLFVFGSATAANVAVACEWKSIP